MRFKTPAILAGLALLVTTSGAPLDALAQPAPVRQVVPYSGHLDLNGAPFDGPAAIRFQVYTEPADGEPAWAETHSPVAVRAGRFAVRLGEQPTPDGQPSIFELASAGVQLYLELSVASVPAEGAQPDWTRLAGRQAIHPVPQAVWTATGSDLRVSTLTADGQVTAGSLTVAGGASVGGQLQANTVRVLSQINNTNGPVVIGDDLTVNGELVQQTIRRDGFADRNQRGGGPASPEGPRSDTHFCALTKVIVNQNPPGDPECDIFQANGRNILRAVNAHCTMTCLRYR